MITVGVGAKLDRETTDKDGFELTVLAIDKGSPPRTGATTVNVTIMDVNDSPPEITPTNVVFPVYENASDEVKFHRNSEIFEFTKLNVEDSLNTLAR